MSTGNYNLCIDQGVPFTLSLTATDSVGAAINLSGYDVRASLRRRYTDSSPLMNFSGLIVSDVSGMVMISIPATGTAALPATRLVYDLEAYNDTTYDVIKLLKGAALVYPEVTY